MNHPNTSTVRLASRSAAVMLAMAGTLAAAGIASAQVVRAGAAADRAGLQAIVDTYRADLGQLNPFTPGSVGSGRREVNWDGARRV